MSMPRSKSSSRHEAAQADVGEGARNVCEHVDDRHGVIVGRPRRRRAESKGLSDLRWSRAHSHQSSAVRIEAGRLGHELVHTPPAEVRARLVEKVADLDARIAAMEQARRRLGHALTCEHESILECPTFRAGLRQLLRYR